MTTSNVNGHDETIAEESRGDRRQPTEERVDAMFDVLADARRRRVVRILRSREVPISASALAAALAEREPGDPDPDQLVLSLRHVHLPKLDATGVVAYDPDRSRIRYDAPALLERLLAQV
jgi:DNA-binding transcriptional ArsR family regulator